MSDDDSTADASHIQVSIDHRAEGYLLTVEIPLSTVQALTEPDLLGHWGEHLARVVPLHGYHEENGTPQIVKVHIDVVNDA